MPCVHVFLSANHQLGLYLRRMFVPRSKNVVSNAEIHDIGGLKSTAKVSLYDHDYGPSYYARCHKVVAQCTVLLYVRHGLELGCSSWSVFSTDGDRREIFFVLKKCLAPPPPARGERKNACTDVKLTRSTQQANHHRGPSTKGGLGWTTPGAVRKKQRL